MSQKIDAACVPACFSVASVHQRNRMREKENDAQLFRKREREGVLHARWIDKREGV